MNRTRILGVTCLGVLLLPLLFVQGQPIESSKEAREMFKGYTGKLAFGLPPKEVIATMRELEAIAYELQVGVPFRVERMLIHQDPGVRRQAARTLASIGANPFTAGARVDTVTRHLNDRDPEVVEALLLALTYIGPNAKSALPKVLEAFKHGDPRVRRAAMGFFVGFLPENQNLMPTVIAALDDPDIGPDEKKPGYGSVSMSAINALRRYGPDAKEVAPKLIQMLKDNKNGDPYEISILNTLIRVKPDEPFALNIIREWLRRKESPEHIVKAANLTPRRKDGKPAVPELIAALEIKPFGDPNLEQRIKRSLLEAFQRIGPDAKEALPAIRSLAGTGNLTLRRQVEKTIAAIEGAK